MKRLLLTILVVTTSGVASLANERNDKLLAMSEEDRNAAFTDVVRNAGECDRVVRSMLMGIWPNGRASWSVGCANQRSYHVDVRDEFRPFALTCEDYKAFGALADVVTRGSGDPPPRRVECWQKF